MIDLRLARSAAITLASSLGVLAPMAQAADPAARQAVRLTPEQSAFVRNEMRGFLVALQGMNEGLARQDFEYVARMARQSGHEVTVGAPPGLGKAFPEGFRELGSATHKTFDQIAIDALEIGDAQLTAEQIAGLMRNCIECHAAYRIEEVRR